MKFVHLYSLITHTLAHSLTHAQDRQVAQWLRTLMEDGQSAIDRFIANPVNEKQRKLAIRYRAAVRLTEEERTSTH